MSKLELKNCNMVLTKKMQKILALPSGKIDKNEYLAGEEILSSDQSRMLEQVTFTHSSLGKDLEKQIKTVEDQGEKQI